MREPERRQREVLLAVRFAAGAPRGTPTDTTATITFGGQAAAEADERASLAPADAAAVDACPRAAPCWWCSAARAPAAATCSTPTCRRSAGIPRATSSSTTSPSPAPRRVPPARRGFRVHDVGSLNGTYVNGDRVDDAELQNGDEVRIGKFRLIFFASDAKGS